MLCSTCFAGMEMSENFPELVIRSFSDLADAFRAIQNHLQISNSTIEHIAGACPGFVDKYIGRSRSKKLSEVSFNLLIGALGLELVVRPDPEALRRVKARYSRRNEKQVRDCQPVSQELISRVARELGRRGALARDEARRAHNGRHNGHAANGHANGKSA
jgi:hypothetical protein